MSTKLNLAAAVTLGMALALPAEAGQATTRIFEFDRADSQRRWAVVNDNVMGGVSRGTRAVAGGMLRFSGKTSLANNGGFSWVRSHTRERSLDGFAGIALRVKGDGRAYKMTLETNARYYFWPVTYWTSFTTTKGEWQTVRIPFSAFTPTHHGRTLKGPKLDAAKVRRFGVIIYDKKAGPFQIDVKWIGAYRDVVGKNIVQTAAAAGQFKTLLTAAKAAGLAGLLQQKGPFTVLAPNDAAFAKVPKATLAALLRPENKGQLAAVLKYHVIPGRIDALTAIKAGKAKTALGQPLGFAIKGGRLTVGKATVLANDIGATNGVIHVIDTVLIPKLPRSGDCRKRCTEVIEKAIEQGVTLFNAGKAEDCSQVYLGAARRLLGSKALPAMSRGVLKVAVAQGPRIGDARERAWVLRTALDMAMIQLKAR